MKQKFFTLFAAAALVLCMGACVSGEEPNIDWDDDIATPAQLKPGIWTEYDEALLASGKYTEEQLAAMPAVGMMLEGNKASFFTYTAEGASNAVEGQISYDNTEGTGSITFPAINNNPLSGQTVDFYMTTDETMQFVLTYEGQQTTATFAWLCENLNSWNQEEDDEDWEALLAEYQLIDEDEGPDASIDWSLPVEVEVTDDEGNPVKMEVTDLDKPLEWNEDAAEMKAATRVVGIGAAIKAGLNILGALFEEDPAEETNGKLDLVLGKLDNVLANQQVMNLKLDEINGRLKAIANQLNQQEVVGIFNNRDKEFYNKLKVRNKYYFNDAYKKYKANKNDPELADYAKEWAGKDEEYITMTWEYIEYLTSVQHTKYGKGMDNIYDALTFEKYPWEHMGTGDRQSYRAYDLIMITKCLFMISLYSQYGGLSNIKQKGLYNSYKDYKPLLLAYSKFSITNPDEFRVCQIPGAHFVMRKEIQKYNYLKNNEAPVGHDAIYMPKWHEAGTPKIENPEALKSKLIRMNEMTAVKNYYNPKDENIKWMKMLVDGDNSAGAVYAKDPTSSSPYLLLYNTDRSHNGAFTMEHDGQNALVMYGLMTTTPPGNDFQGLGYVSGNRWTRVSPTVEFYLAIVEKRF